MFKETVKKYYISIVLILIMFLLEYSYISYVSDVYAKYNFKFDFNIFRYIISKIIFIIPLFLIERSNKFDRFILSIFTLLMIIPNLIIFEFIPDTPIIINLSLIFFVTFYYSLSFVKIPLNLKILVLSSNYKVLLIASLAILMFVPFIFVYGFDLHFNAFNYDEIYKIRETSSLKGNLFTAYFFPWLVKVIVPVGMIISLKYRKWYLLVGLLLIQLYMFLLFAHKSVFISFFVLFFYFFKNEEKQLKYFISSILCLLFISVFISYITDNIIVESMFSRRLFFVPALLNNCYFDFFADNHTYLSHSVFKNFIDYSLPLSPDHMIGKEYFGQPKMASNNGFISDGFMNFGLIGVILNSIALAFVLKVIKFLKISYIYYGVILILIFAFISSYFLTTLLTHGVLLFIFVSFLILRNSAIES
jgi:hypothetical protein